MIRLLLPLVAVVLGALHPGAAIPGAQALGPGDRSLLQAMLKDAYEAVRANYFDRTYNGVDWTGRYARFQAALADVSTLHAGLTTIADMLEGLDDSHTVFYPPGWLREVDYGYDLLAVGDDIVVSDVRAGSDAADKLRPGDRVLSLNGRPISRRILPRIRYELSALTPLAESRVAVRDPGGAERTVDVRSTVSESRALRMLGGGIRISDFIRAEQEAEFRFRARTAVAGSVLVWRMPRFISDLGDITRVADEARSHAGVVLDLRGNPGGYLEALRRVTSVLFPENVTVGTLVERRGRSTISVSPRRNRTVDGRLVVLIDSDSASSSEVLARLVQSEGRGTVVGDVSAGAVRLAQPFPFAHGFDAQTPYAISVTVADLLMKDGSSLERRGVTPDERVLPTPDDLAAGRDPALARAVTLAGGSLDADAAGRVSRSLR